MKTKNVKLLISRLEAQLDSPEAARFNMRYFGNVFNLGMVNLLQAVKENPPACYTQACLAGETVLALKTGRLLESGGIALPNGRGGWAIEAQAAEDLGLTPKQRKRLFFFVSMNSDDDEPLGWPAKFEEAYRAAKTPQGRLYVAIRRVEHFLATKGRE